MEIILKFLRTLQSFLEEASIVPIFYVSFNFFIAVFASFISFPIFSRLKEGDIFEIMFVVRDLKKKLKSSFTLFVLRYSIVTGMAAAALI